MPERWRAVGQGRYRCPIAVREAAHAVQGTAQAPGAVCRGGLVCCRSGAGADAGFCRGGLAAGDSAGLVMRLCVSGGLQGGFEAGAAVVCGHEKASARCGGFLQVSEKGAWDCCTRHRRGVCPAAAQCHAVTVRSRHAALRQGTQAVRRPTGWRVLMRRFPGVTQGAQ